MSTQDFTRDEVKETLRRVYRVIMTWPCPPDDVLADEKTTDATDNPTQNDTASNLMTGLPGKEQRFIS